MNTTAELKEKRKAYGISQRKLAVIVGVTENYICKIEKGYEIASQKCLDDIAEALERLNPDNPLELIFDYVRVRFPTTDSRKIIGQLLQFSYDYMIHEDWAFYGYVEQYVMGDIVVMVSPEKEKGVLLELKGKGCRQLEYYMVVQGRDWFGFLKQAMEMGGIVKRIDLAINDKYGMLDIPELIKKCEADECVSVFRSFDSRTSGELIRQKEACEKEMGNTLYIGSKKSDVYFCIYAKAYEQYIKNGIAIEEAKIRNRFEIRLKNDRAKHALEDLLVYQDVDRTIFSIINRYVRFVDTEENKRREDWKLNERWEWFIGNGRGQLRLTTKPEPYTLERTLNWLARQVAPTLKTVKKLEELQEKEILNPMVAEAKLSSRHQKIIKQQMSTMEGGMLCGKGGDAKKV